MSAADAMSRVLRSAAAAALRDEDHEACADILRAWPEPVDELRRRVREIALANLHLSETMALQALYFVADDEGSAEHTASVVACVAGDMHVVLGMRIGDLAQAAGWPDPAKREAESKVAAERVHDLLWVVAELARRTAGGPVDVTGDERAQRATFHDAERRDDKASRVLRDVADLALDSEDADEGNLQAYVCAAVVASEADAADAFDGIGVALLRFAGARIKNLATGVEPSPGYLATLAGFAKRARLAADALDLYIEANAAESR